MGEFFSEMTHSSRVKATIVERYFDAWARVLCNRPNVQRIAYVDLFCGPGRYEDGTPSTPLKILDRCCNNLKYRNKVVTIFNDQEPDFVSCLDAEISALHGIDCLTHKPQVKNYTVDTELANLFQKMSMIPTLSFIDPWGYKGLTRDLVCSLIKDWGSDSIFFFNYNRINAALTNPKVTEHINAIFGEPGATSLRKRIRGQNSTRREALIINDLATTLSNEGTRFVLPFRFEDDDKNRTSHYLVFVSKHKLGYRIMKDIMYDCSSEKNDGVASFSYLPVTDPQLSLLYGLSQPLEELGCELLKLFAGRSLSVNDIFEFHNVGTPFVMRNYKEALRRLEEDGQIKTFPEKRPIRRGVITMGDDVIIQFPSR